MKSSKIILIFLLGLFLRTIGISSLPAGFTADEAAFGYNAYSLLTTGKDEWGVPFPLALRSFGDFKLPLYAYIDVPFVSIFGLTPTAVRLPSALLGSFAVLVIYLLTKELAADFDKSEFTPLLSAILLAFSPWHIMISRGAFEANLTTFLSPLGLLLMIKGLRRETLLYLGVMVLGLNLYSYHSARMFTFFILVIFFLYFKDKISLLSAKWLKALGIFFIFALPMMVSFVTKSSRRVSDIAIFHPTDNWQNLAETQYFLTQSGKPRFITRIFENKITTTTRTFLENYFSYLSPQFLFTSGPSESTYGMMPGRGVLYLWVLPLLLIAISTAIKYPSSQRKILALVLLGFIPASLAKGLSAAARAATVIPFLELFVSLGFSYWWLKNSRRHPLKSPLVKLTFLIFSIYISLSYIFSYVFLSPLQTAPSMAYGWKQATAYLNKFPQHRILINRGLSEPHIFIAFYNKLDPATYQTQTQDWYRYEKQNLKFLDMLGEYSLGRYTIKTVDFNTDINLSDTIIVAKPFDINAFKITPDYVINYPSGQPALVIIHSRKTLQ